RAATVRIGVAGERQAPAIEHDVAYAAPGRADAICHLERVSSKGHHHAHPVELSRHYRIDAKGVCLLGEPEEAPEGEAERDAGAARIHPPTAVERNLAVADMRVICACMVAVGESCIGARVVAVRLTQRSRRNDRANADGVCLTERAEELFRSPNMRQGLCVAQVR